MRELLEELPDPDALLDLAPEELGERLLVLLKARMAASPGEFNNGGMFHPLNLGHEIWPRTSVGLKYPREKQPQIDLALTEAWQWLKSERFIVPAPDGNGQSGFCVLSRKAARVASREDLRRLRASSKPAREVLHPEIAKIWPRLLRGDLDGAVFDAMHAVEVAARDAAALSNRDIGVGLMRSAFHPEKGPLTDTTAEGGERQALSDLFAGAIGTYKNPRSHRRVNLADPDEAIEILMLASNLLRIVERAKRD